VHSTAPGRSNVVIALSLVVAAKEVPPARRNDPRGRQCPERADVVKDLGIANPTLYRSAPANNPWP